MKINISGKEIKLTDALKQYVEEKLHKLDKYLTGVEPVNIDVELHSSQKSKGQPRETVEVTLKMPEAIIRATETNEDMYGAIDIIQEKIERKIRDYKERFLSERKQGLEDGADMKEVKRAIKRKKFDLGIPILEDEAIDRMNLLGHDFYVFINVKTGLQSVVYRRKDGGYGIIESK
jgi:putative sigma-54 modulation protein